MNYVIGSGPAGVAAAAALLDHGEPVTMLDAGGELEPDIAATVAALAARQPEEWAGEAVERVKGRRLRYNAEGAPLKLVFGSDFPYRDVDTLQPLAADGVDAYRALASGGLSVLWGASILPFSDADFAAWPVTAAEMGPHYVSALGMTGLTGADDPLAQVYPLHVAPTTLSLSSQARFIWERASRDADALRRQHVLVGHARLAVRQPSISGHACTYCGMCLYGCPYGLIYSAAHTLETRLRPAAGFTYMPGIVVRRLAERGGAVVIDAVEREGRRPRTFAGERVFLAAGVLDSTAILLRSLGAWRRQVTLRQSDHFLLPLLLRGFSGRERNERLHTLSQLFIEVLDRSVSPHGVHLQLYTYSDFYTRMAKDVLGPLYAPTAPLVARVLDRAAVIKGYLHSDESAGIRATLDDGGGVASPLEPGTLRLQVIPSARAGEVVRAVSRVLQRNRRSLGLLPIGVGRRLGRPGSGVHTGGSFPMRTAPGECESDVLGRPTGFERLHVVDSTVFPTLPAAPPTLTIMANAVRIASAVAQGRAAGYIHS